MFDPALMSARAETKTSGRDLPTGVADAGLLLEMPPTTMRKIAMMGVFIKKSMHVASAEVAAYEAPGAQRESPSIFAKRDGTHDPC